MSVDRVPVNVVSKRSCNDENFALWLLRYIPTQVKIAGAVQCCGQVGVQDFVQQLIDGVMSTWQCVVQMALTALSHVAQNTKMC